MTEDRDRAAAEHRAAEEHRRLGTELFNEVWNLLERTDRTVDDDLRMLHMAHASRFHWGEGGEPVNLVRGEWQCSRVYAVLGRGEPALFHARRCLEICEANGIGDFDLAYAYEAMARALLTAGERAEAAPWIERARAAGDAIAEADDREIFAQDLVGLTA